MCQADLSRLRESASTDHRHIRNRVMGRTERTLRHQGSVQPDLAGDRMYLGGLERLLQGKRWQDGRETFGEHRFATPRRTDQDQVVASGGGYFQRTLHILLSAYIREIRFKLKLPGIKFFTGIDNRRLQIPSSCNELNHFFDGRNAIHIQVIDDSGLTGILLGNDKTFESLFTRLDRNRQNSLYRLQAAVQ